MLAVLQLTNLRTLLFAKLESFISRLKFSISHLTFWPQHWQTASTTTQSCCSWHHPPLGRKLQCYRKLANCSQDKHEIWWGKIFTALCCRRRTKYHNLCFFLTWKFKKDKHLYFSLYPQNISLESDSSKGGHSQGCRETNKKLKRTKVFLSEVVEPVV